MIARHASARPVAGSDAYKLSGAGVKSIRANAGLSDKSARRGRALEARKVILPVAVEVKKRLFREVGSGARELDLDLPHAFVLSSLLATH